MHISIEKHTLETLKKWFSNYVYEFQTSEPEVRKNIDLKITHTYRVCNEILNIGKKLGLSENELRLAEIIALFHDIGRFEQYACYRTFNDGNSQNHAELGVNILNKLSIIDSIDTNLQHILRQSIRYHNLPKLPNQEDQTCLFYAKLIRDADKLDIWKVVTDYYNRVETQSNRAIELELPLTPGFSEKVYQDLLNRQIVNIQHVKNLNDLKLLQMGWIFDINFQPTMACIKKRRYIEMIRDVLPESKKIDNVYHLAVSEMIRVNSGQP